MHDAFLGSEPAQLRIAGKPPPEAAEVFSDLVQGETDDVIAKGLDGGRADVVAAPNREGESMSFDAAVGLQDDVRRRVVRIGMHRIGAVLRTRRRKAEIDCVRGRVIFIADIFRVSR